MTTVQQARDYGSQIMALTNRKLSDTGDGFTVWSFGQNLDRVGVADS